MRPPTGLVFALGSDSAAGATVSLYVAPLPPDTRCPRLLAPCRAASWDARQQDVRAHIAERIVKQVQQFGHDSLCPKSALRHREAIGSLLLVLRLPVEGSIRLSQEAISDLEAMSMAIAKMPVLWPPMERLAYMRTRIIFQMVNTPSSAV